MNPILRLPENQHGRDFVVGDIHGHFAMLNELMEVVAFDRNVDRLFAVGDLIDRGPNSADVLRLTLEPWFFSAMGNHELMMLDAVCGWAHDCSPAMYSGEPCIYRYRFFSDRHRTANDG